MDFFPSSGIKTKPKRLKLLRFERGFCFRLQVKNKNKGGRGEGVINLISWVPLSELISNTKSDPTNSVYYLTTLAFIIT
jgi:hypothetical protein